MANVNQERITERDITGLKLLEQIVPLLKRLHLAGCERDKAGNRKLHYDEYCLQVLLFLFNPIVTSLRGVQQASELANVQKKLGCPRTSLGSLSESRTVFDPELLKGIIGELSDQLKPVARDPRLSGIPRAITAVDGTLLDALPSMMHASVLKNKTGSGMVKWRLHTHFEVDRHVPTRIDVTPNGGGDNDERAVLGRTIESDRTYVTDRGYAKFKLLNAVNKADSSYVCRLRDNSKYTVIEDRPLTDEDRANGILRSCSKIT